MNGILGRIAGDLVRDPQAGTAFYTGAVTISAEEMHRIDGMRLLPGMPAEVFLNTGERTLASYIVKPVTDQFHRALRER